VPFSVTSKRYTSQEPRAGTPSRSPYGDLTTEIPP
jgi:hypothetical protein